ncbi:MAG: S9 family peptidase [Terriglobia bacterium]|nr:MAG: S9 family peptidase [Terriglobia bacterium]
MLLGALCAFAQTSPFTIDQVLSSAFPTHLTTAATGGKVAWASSTRGVINIMVAEAPGYVARKVTGYTEDDGQDIDEIRWTADARAIVYVRGGGPNRAGEYPNPTSDPRGSEQAVWIRSLDGLAPRRIGEGGAVAVSPRNDRVAYTRRGQIWWAPLDGSQPPSQPFQSRGQSQRPLWSPDGSRLAFVSGRGDHSFIGVFDVNAGTLRFLDPSTDSDSEPVWSPDSRRVAFVREPSHAAAPVYGARRSDEPWSIRIADAIGGEGREIWRAQEGPGSVFREIAAPYQLFWSAAERIVFPWEGDGWTHLYSVPVAGGKATPLTPGEFEVEYVSVTPDGRDIIFNSNQGDIDRRHLWKVAASGGTPALLTPGEGIEWSPAVTGDAQGIAFVRSDSRRPAHPSILLGKEIRDLDPGAIQPDFPLRHMVAPQPVTFGSTDGYVIHGQLFSPPNPRGRAPAIVFFHGGSRRQMLLGWHYRSYYHNAYAFNQYLANKGYIVLSVNYRSGIGYGLNFREALNFGATGASEYNDVQSAARFLRARGDVDPSRIGVWGGSYGGYLTALALARDSGTFRAGVDLHGVHDWALEYDIPPTEPANKLAFDSSPMAFLDGWRSPVLLIQGDDDRNVKFRQTVLLADALRKRKVAVEQLIFPDEVHEFLLFRHWREAYEAADRFLDKYLLR